MKKILLFTTLFVSTVGFSQKKVTAYAMHYLNEDGSPNGIDSSTYMYADYQGSMSSNGPIFGAGEGGSPIFWNWMTPEVDFTTSASYYDGTPTQTNAKLYNAAHQVTSNTSSNLSREVYTYTATGKIETYTTEFDNSGNWEPNYLVEYYYDALDRLIVQNTTYYNMGVGFIGQTDTLTYFTTTTNVESFHSSSSEDGITFFPEGIIDYTYSGNNPATFNYYINYDGDPGTPLEYLLAVTYNYTGSNLTSLVGLLVENNVPTTTEAVVIDYLYDGANRLVSDLQSGMFGLYGHSYVYDAEGFVTKVSTLSENQAGDDVYPSEEEFFYYQSTADIVEVSEIDFTVFPNPSSAIFTVSSENEITSLTVYSLDGKRLISQKGGDSMNASNLPNGNYFIEVATSKGVARKMISKI